jgi:dCMP deaminase
MQLAEVAATRTTCIRKGVGCVLADGLGRVLAIGYNGVASGQPHCNEATSFKYQGFDAASVAVHGHACIGHTRPFGEPTNCEAVHAEQNAILQCKDTDAIYTAYVTTAPCKPCVKLLLNTGCCCIVFLNGHPGDEEARVLFSRACCGRRTAGSG